MLTIFSTVFSVYWSRRPSSSFCLRAAGTHAAARRDVHWANYRRNQQQLNWPPMCEVNSQWSGTRDDHLHGAEWVGSACELQTFCWQCFPWMTSLLPANPIDLLHGERRGKCATWSVAIGIFLHVHRYPNTGVGSWGMQGIWHPTIYVGRYWYVYPPRKT